MHVIHQVLHHLKKRSGHVKDCHCGHWGIWLWSEEKWRVMFSMFESRSKVVTVDNYPNSKKQEVGLGRLLSGSNGLCSWSGFEFVSWHPLVTPDFLQLYLQEDLTPLTSTDICAHVNTHACTCTHTHLYCIDKLSMMTLWVQHFEVDITVVSTEHLKFELGKLREWILNLM